jgi:hypothetical protein
VWPWYRRIFLSISFLICTLCNELDFVAAVRVSDVEIFYLSGSFHVMHITRLPNPLNQITQLKDTEGYFV